MSQGKSIKLFLADGTPGGIITAEIINWTGHVISAPRSRLADVLKRAEANRAGLYVLLGDDPNQPDQRLAYIGESEAVGERLAQHNKPEASGGKDFWDRVFVITSKDANLTKGHLRYVESRLITIADEAGRMSLANVKGKQNEYGALPEADKSDMLYFIEQLKLVLPSLGLELLREVGRRSVAETQQAPASAQSPLFELFSKGLGIRALGQEMDGEFVVLKGSLLKPSWDNDKWINYKRQHDALPATHKVETDTATGLWRLLDDVAFTSPSMAAAVVLGRNANGRTEWKVKDSGQSYADWQEAQLTQVVASDE